MNGWTVRFAPPAQKELEKLPAQLVRRIEKAVDKLAANPRPPGYKKMQGMKDTYRIRVGDYRIVYEIHEKEVLILIIRVRHRKDAY